MGRAPCCDKANVKKGPWSPEEDAKLKSYIDTNGTGGNWIALPQKIGLKRCGKSCRLRWLNYLRPNIKHGGFSEEEDNLICSLYISIGSRWSIIAAQLPGRTDNDIKNYWNTRLKKKLLGKQRKELQARRGINHLKQENSMVSETNQNPYWRPELPPPVSLPHANQEPGFNDHASIRKLLVKLGGKFSDDDDQIINGGTDFQFPLDMSSTQQFYQQSISLPSTVDALNNTQFAHMLQGETNFLPELEEMVYRNPSRVEFLYGDDMINTRIGTSFGENISWGETSSPVHPPFSSNYEVIQEGALQDSVCNGLDLPLYSGRNNNAFDGLRYSGVQ